MIMVGVPTYSGQMEWKTVSSLLGLCGLCAKASVGYAMDVIPGCAFIGLARNMLAHRFLKMGFRDLLFVDADVSFDPIDAARLCKAEPEIVFGLYRKKDDRLVFPARYREPLETHPSDPDLIRMLWGPTGFMRIRREVFERMIEAYPDDWYEDGESGERIYNFFPGGGHVGHKFASEDVAFCEKADKIGLKLWAMQGIALQHTGTKSWPSNWVRTGPVLVEADAQPA